MVNDTSASFTQVAESSSKVGQLVAQIASASNEQAQGIEQLNRAMLDMERVTQQNATTAEESSEASKELSAQASRMKDVVQGLVGLVGGKKSDGPLELDQPDRKKRPTAHKIEPQSERA